MSLAQNFHKPEDPKPKCFPPLARATCTPQKWHPQWILSWHSIHVTYEFGISGASRLTCRCVRIFNCANHLRVLCTCTMHPSPFFIRPQVSLASAPMYRVWCRQLKVSLNRRTPRQKSFPPLARAACASPKRQSQKHLSWGGIRMTCEFGSGSALRLTCRCVRIFLKAFTRRHVPRVTCRRPNHNRHNCRSGVSARPSVPPRSRSDQPFGRYPRKCLDTHTHRLTNTIRPTFFRRPTGGNLCS